VSRVPDVSVVVAARDVAAYLPDTLAGLQSNACTPDGPLVEAVVVDDGSTDATPDLLAAAALRYPWLRVLRHEQPAGLATARRAGLAACTGRLLTFLDGDDWYGPGYLGGLVARMDELDVDVVRVDHIRVLGRRRTVVRAPEPRRNTRLDPRSGILPVDRTTMVDYPYQWAGIYRRSVYEAGLLQCHEDLLTAEDRPWVWRIHREVESYAVTDVVGVFYRRGVAGALTAVADERQLHYLRAFEYVFTELATDPEAELFHPKAVRTFCAIAAHHLAQSHRLAPELRRRHRAEVGLALRRLPGESLAAAFRAIGVGRRALLVDAYDAESRRTSRRRLGPTRLLPIRVSLGRR
jgi:glycosyltransferase involved in cell wall biosynthesis